MEIFFLKYSLRNFTRTMRILLLLLPRMGSLFSHNAKDKVHIFRGIEASHITEHLSL